MKAKKMSKVYRVNGQRRISENIILPYLKLYYRTKLKQYGIIIKINS